MPSNAAELFCSSGGAAHLLTRTRRHSGVCAGDASSAECVTARHPPAVRVHFWRSCRSRHDLAAAKAVASRWGSAREPSAPSVLSQTLRAAFLMRVSSSTARAATVVERAGGVCNGPLGGGVQSGVRALVGPVFGWRGGVYASYICLGGDRALLGKRKPGQQPDRNDNCECPRPSGRAETRAAARVKV